MQLTRKRDFHTHDLNKSPTSTQSVRYENEMANKKIRSILLLAYGVGIANDIRRRGTKID